MTYGIDHVFVITPPSCQSYAAVHYWRMTPMKRIRIEILKLSQTELAQIAAVNQATVSRWDAGSREPGRVEMQLIREYAKRKGARWSDKWFFEAAE